MDGIFRSFLDYPVPSQSNLKVHVQAFVANCIHFIFPSTVVPLPLNGHQKLILEAGEQKYLEEQKIFSPHCHLGAISGMVNNIWLILIVGDGTWTQFLIGTRQIINISSHRNRDMQFDLLGVFLLNFVRMRLCYNFSNLFSLYFFENVNVYRSKDENFKHKQGKSQMLGCDINHTIFTSLNTNI